jgi:hypothetical protein
MLSLAGCGGTGETARTEAEPEPTQESGTFLSKIFTKQPQRFQVPTGTVLTVRFQDHLSSHTSQTGQTFRARVTQAIAIDGTEVIPAGAAVIGTVTEARGPKKVGGRARLTLDFHTLQLAEGEPLAIAAIFATVGKSETPKDAAIIGGSTLAGAVLGEKVDDGEGGVVGAIVGGLVGTAAAIKTKGKPVEVPADTVMSVELTRPVTVEVG